jgi:hypothetical protein
MTSDPEVDVNGPIVPRPLVEAVHAHTRDTTSPAVRAATKRRILERVESAPRSSPWKGLVPVFAGAVLVLGVLGGAWWTGRHPRPAQLANESASASAQSARAATATTATVTVRAIPLSTTLTWDGNPITNPATFAAPRDGAAHVVGAEATGYRARTETIVVDTTAVEVEMELEPDPSAPPP